MRRLLIIAVLLVVAILVGVAVALSVVDADRLREPIVSRISERLQRTVELRELELILFPLPALRLSGLRVEGSTPEAPLLEVNEARLRMAFLPLFLGRVVLRAVELDAPRVRLELDAQGRLQLPGSTEPAERASSPVADAPAREMTLAVDTVRIVDGALEVGPWRVEKLELQGRLRLDRSAEFTFEADLSELGRLREGRVDLRGVGTDALSIAARGKLEAVDLAELGQRLALEAQLAGRVDGTFEVGVEAGTLRTARLDFRARQLALASNGFELAGEAELAAVLGGAWKLDLTRSRIDWGEALRKPAGLVASFSGELGSTASLAALRDVLVRIGPNRLELELALDAATPHVRIRPVTLELEPLMQLSREPLDLGGRIELGAWEVELEPLALAGDAKLDGVTLGLQHGSVTLEGLLRAQGTRLYADDVRILAAGESATLSGSYDLVSGLARLDGGVSGVQVEALAKSFFGSSELAGLLEGRVSLRGPLSLVALEGEGQLEITDGRIRGFSLLQQILGGLAALPVLLAQLKGRDLSRYEEEEFQRLAADFRLKDGKLYMDNLTLEYRHARAQLHGTVSLTDGALALSGQVVITRELDAELADRKSGREQVIPIAGIKGTVTRPRVQLDRAALASLASVYTGQGKFFEKLEEKLGKEGAEAVGGWLDQILRGRKQEP